jgi:hypothetical protein
MTLTVTVITWEYAACATDRRLSATGKVVSESARKLIQLDTGSFKGLLAYNGIGRTATGETPNDWVAGAQAQGQANLFEFCARLKSVTEPRLRALAPKLQNNPRHTFVLAGFEGAVPVMGLVSNYESMDASIRTQALDELEIGFVSPKRTTRFGYIITGAANIVRRRSIQGLHKALEQNEPRERILGKMTKIIRDTAYVDRMRGSVGSSVLTSVFDPMSGFQGGGGAVGGSEFIEIPDAYFNGVQCRNIWVSGSLSDGSRYNPALGRFDFVEVSCPNCRNPVPDGQIRCGSCDHPMR